MKSNKLLYAVITLVAVNIGITLWFSQSSPKIAYVRSHDLVYGYAGMKETQNQFQSKAEQWQANIDTLQSDYSRSLSKFMEESSKLELVEKKKYEDLLKGQQNNLVQYSKAISEKAQDEENQMLEGVLNQVNSFVQDYGKEHGYDMIFGTTLSGSVLYGQDAIDITDEVLAELNKTYKGL